jgi:hypothetical protein
MKPEPLIDRERDRAQTREILLGGAVLLVGAVVLWWFLR